MSGDFDPKLDISNFQGPDISVGNDDVAFDDGSEEEGARSIKGDSLW
jgi:hypothetical protein